MNDNTPEITVIIVTYNPRKDLLAWALDSLEKQTLSKRQFEVIIVDNNSSPPIELPPLLQGRSLNLRLVQERQQGIMHARRAGILESTAELITFVDDDNHLAANYLEQSLNIAKAHQEIGAFGGRAKGVFEAPLKNWQEKLVRHLGVRDFGDEPITSNVHGWGPWEPIGAGMVVRTTIAQKFAQRLTTEPLCLHLGRAGLAQMSGDDALLSRTAYQLGWNCSYQPSLILQHYMKKERLTFNRICKTIEGHGRSEVLLMKIDGIMDSRPRMPRNLGLLLASLVYRIVTQGPRMGYIEWHWDLGYWREIRNRS
jgi:cellulose synthase/poly-beta-1,6-N-acetylglucosamine synthase-like glycosyltransferase